VEMFERPGAKKTVRTMGAGWPPPPPPLSSNFALANVSLLAVPPAAPILVEK